MRNYCKFEACHLQDYYHALASAHLVQQQAFICPSFEWQVSHCVVCFQVVVAPGGHATGSFTNRRQRMGLLRGGSAQIEGRNIPNQNSYCGRLTLLVLPIESPSNFPLKLKRVTPECFYYSPTHTPDEPLAAGVSAHSKNLGIDGTECTLLR